MQVRRNAIFHAGFAADPAVPPLPGYTSLAMHSTKPSPRQRQTVLFLCRHNAVRSQIAESLLRTRFSKRYDVASAGTAPSEVHPLAIRVLEEIGGSTTELRSKSVEEFRGRSFDIVATVCGQDELSCPFFPGGRQLHRAFDDPSSMGGLEEDCVAAFRRTRDEIDAWIQAIFG